MGYRCWAERFVTADFSGTPVHYQSLKPTDSIALKAIRSRFVIYNSPTFTTLSMRVYSGVSSAPGALLHTFDTTWTKAQITSYANAAMEIYFEFTNPRHFHSGDTYYFVPWITGYTGDENSHVGWIKAFPDPAYTTGLTVNPTTIAALPYNIGIIGATL